MDSRAGQPQILRPHRLSRQVARACLDMANNVCVVIALRHLTLTLFYILVFMAPIVISLLSAIFLREGLPWKRAAAIVAGFAGVIIAVHPWSSAHEGDWIGFTACLVCVACFSTNMVWSRVLTQTESPESLAFFSGIVTAVVGFALMAFVHAAPLTIRLTTGLLAMGLFCALGTLCFYIAVKHTSAANVSQYHYTQLVTGTLVSYLIWRNKPGFYVLLGGTLILASGLYIAVTTREMPPIITRSVEGTQCLRRRPIVISSRFNLTGFAGLQGPWWGYPSLWLVRGPIEANVSDGELSVGRVWLRSVPGEVSVRLVGTRLLLCLHSLILSMTVSLLTQGCRHTSGFEGL